MIEAEVNRRPDGTTMACYTGARDQLINAGLATSKMIPLRRSWARSRNGAETSWKSTQLPDGRWAIRYFGTLTGADLSEAEDAKVAAMRQEVRRLLDRLDSSFDDDEGTELL